MCIRDRAYISQELGYALAWGNEYMNQLTEAGVPAALVAKKIKFNFGISSNYFLEIAKFRAARMLWANIVASYDADAQCAAKMRIHAETSTFNLTLFDAHVNLLRTQTEAMSAALAGVDSMTVTPVSYTHLCFIVIVINQGLKRYGGDLSIGAFGIVNRLVFIFVMIVMGLNQGMQPLSLIHIWEN